MSSVLRPVGPEKPGTYWRRRAVAIGGLVLTFLLVLLLLSQCGADGGAPVADPSPTPTPTASPTASGTPTPTEEPTSASPTPTPTQEAPACDDDAITVEVKTNQPSYPPGVAPEITLTIANTSDKACRRDIGATANEIKIESGGYHVWSSDDCATDEKTDVKVLRPGDQAQVVLTWDRKLSAPGCSGDKADAQPGTYQVIGRNAGVESPAVPFALT